MQEGEMQETTAGPTLSQSEIKLNYEASSKVVEACGTAKLFEKRAHWYRRLNKIRDVLGIGVPTMVGAVFYVILVRARLHCIYPDNCRNTCCLATFIERVVNRVWLG